MSSPSSSNEHSDSDDNKSAVASPSSNSGRSGSGSAPGSPAGSASPEGSVKSSASTPSHKSASGSPRQRESKDRSKSRSASGDSTPSHRSPSPKVNARKKLVAVDSDSDSDNSPRKSAKKVQHGSSDDSDIGQSEDEKPKKKKAVVASDSDADGDDEDRTKDKEHHTALFGDDMSSDSDADEEREPKHKEEEQDEREEGEEKEAKREKRASSEESLHGIVMRPGSDEEAEEAEEDKAPTLIQGECSRNDIDLGKEIPPFVKLPNFLSLATKPFDPDHFEDSDEERADEEGRNRLKLKVENTIRWRKVIDDDGNETRESNAKIVKWSDGTMSLYLGSEIFDIESQPMVENNHLYLRQGAGLIGLSVFDNKLKFRPHSTDSKTHRKVTMSMAERTRKSAQVKVLSEVGSNPEKIRQENARKEEEKLRAAIRAQFSTQSKGRRDRDRMYRPDEDDPESLGAIKKRYRDAPLIGASESEGEAEETPKGGGETSDSDEEFRKKKQQQQKKFVVTDDESD